MKKIFSFILLACLSLTAVAQSKPQAFKAMMQQQRLSNTIKSLSSSAQAPAQINAFDTTEVIFKSFYDDPMYTPVETIVNRNGDTVVALVDDSATVKTFYKEANHIRLQPENDTMDPIIVDNCEILGKVFGVFRYYKN